MDQITARVTDDEALQMHASGRPGKIEITATKPLMTQRDLSLHSQQVILVINEDLGNVDVLRVASAMES